MEAGKYVKVLVVLFSCGARGIAGRIRGLVSRCRRDVFETPGARFDSILCPSSTLFRNAFLRMYTQGGEYW
jgi:hypothetical protein